MPELHRNAALVDTAIAKLRTKDPSLAEALRYLNHSVNDLQDKVDPLTAAVAAVSEPEPIPQVVDTFTYSLRPRSVHFEWTSTDPVVRFYELRKGTAWETATFVLRTSSLSADIDPISVGSHTYLIRTMNNDLAYSEAAQSLVVTVPAIGTITITPQVIDNTVLLYWTEPTSSFALDYFLVERILSGNRSTVGKKSGTFTTVEEPVSGSYTYIVTAYDIAGNASAENSIIVQVRQPPDFELLTELNSILNGTKVNAVLTDGKLLVCVNTVETFEGHFTSRAWTTPQNQIDAGYPYYIQPTLLTASYEEIFDFGSILSNAIINIRYATEIVFGNFTVAIETKVSDDGISYGSGVAGPSVFAPSVRYAKIKFTFTAGDDNDMLLFYNLQVALDVKREVDSGSITASAGDATGTTVNFNKVFRDISSLTVTPRNPIEPITVVVDFTDIPNPTSFKVRAYDSSGARVTHVVDWKARGIV